MEIVIPFLSSLFFSLIGVGGFRLFATRLGIGSLPTARSMHKQFVPLLGGLGIFFGILIPLLLIHWITGQPTPWAGQQRYFFLGWIVILFTGLLDDVLGLTSWQKFVGEFVAASLLVAGGCVIEAFTSPLGSALMLGWGSIPFTILWIIFIINALNLMDGLDGLAGGISAIAFLGFFLIALIQGNAWLALLALLSCGAVIGFLKYNWHPASIFMGDTGSLQLGYLLAFFSIETLRVAGSHQVYFLASLVILGLPVTDTLISFFRRLSRGESPFKPDVEHVHHRLIKLGLSHKNTVLVLYTISAFFMLLGILMVLYSEVTGYILFGIAFATAIYWTRRLGYLEAFQRYPQITWNEQPLPEAPPLHLNRLWHQVLIFGMDVLAINAVHFLTFWFKFHSGWTAPLTGRALVDYVADPVFLWLTIAWIGLFWLNGLYNMPWDIGRFDKTLRVSKVITFGVLVLGLLTSDMRFPLRYSQISTLAFYWMAMLVGVNGARLLVIQLEKKWQILEYSLKPTLLIGTSRQARNIIQDVRQNPHLLYDIRGIVVKQRPRSDQFAGVPILGTYEDLPYLIRMHRIEEIILAIPEKSRADLLKLAGMCDRLHVVMKTTPSLRQFLTGVRDVTAPQFLVRVYTDPMVQWQWLVKRAMDVGFALVHALLLFPVWLGIALMISVQTRSWPLLRLPALGKFGQPFYLWVFRLGKMVPARYYYGLTHSLTGQDEAQFSFARDVPRWGKFLFYTRLYKMPQVINILRGEMSIVGPRPESPDWYSYYQNRISYLYRRLFVRPGLTGLAQVRYRYESSVKQLQQRVQMDIRYIENLRLRLDFQIILRSLWLFFRFPFQTGDKRP